jgi:hypothetical protein
MLLEKTTAENLIRELALGPWLGAEPVDLVQFTRITPGAAEVLAREWRGDESVESGTGDRSPGAPACFELDLSGLRSLDVESARALARWDPAPEVPDEAVCTLHLGGLRHSPPKVLAALAGWSVTAATASLWLGGFRKLGVARAAALGRWSGGNLVSNLYLGAVEELAADEAGALTSGWVATLSVGLRELTWETAVRLGQAGCQELILPRLERIEPPVLLALAGLTAEGELRPEYASAEFGRAEPLGLFLGGDVRAGLRDVTPELAGAFETVRQRGVKVRLARATERALRAFAG